MENSNKKESIKKGSKNFVEIKNLGKKRKRDLANKDLNKKKNLFVTWMDLALLINLI